MHPLSYRASLKNPDVEEPIDLLVHRPLGYLLARAAYPTPVSPDAITVASMLVGLGAGAALAWPLLGGASHHALGGALLIASAVLDCSDGQLARMRRSSSRYGRMLDGAVDAVVQIAVVPAALLHMVWRRGGLGSEDTAAWLFAGVLTVLAGIRHTTLYDQFKNVYVRNTDPAPRDCDDVEQVEAELARRRAEGALPFLTWFKYWFYLVHLRLVAQTMRWIDPHVPPRFADMPPYSPDGAARYRALNGALMRAWSCFGIGTHIFALGVCLALDRLEWYILLRLVGFNLALLALVPLQRRASRAFFEADRGDDPEPAAAA